MPSRRNHDSLAPRSRPQWLTVTDIYGALVESTPIPPGADPSAAMARTLARIAGDGWQAEGGYSYGFVFVRNPAGGRRLVNLAPVAPGDATGAGHAFLAGHGVGQAGAGHARVASGG